MHINTSIKYKKCYHSARVQKTSTQKFYTVINFFCSTTIWKLGRRTRYIVYCDSCTSALPNILRTEKQHPELIEFRMRRIHGNHHTY